MFVGEQRGRLRVKSPRWRSALGHHQQQQLAGARRSRPENVDDGFESRSAFVARPETAGSRRTSRRRRREIPVVIVVVVVVVVVLQLRDDDERRR